jgi:uncharacterized repeat protein (TIGR03803 family)
MHWTIAKVLALAALTLSLAATSLAQQDAEQILYAPTCSSITGGLSGGNPFGGVILDSKGNLYGTTVDCGNRLGGTVFELTPNADGTWAEQTIYNFDAETEDGSEPYGSLIFDSNGDLYGTTAMGGANQAGTVFELSPGANNTWTEKILFSFDPNPAGNTPETGLVFDAAGNLYGTAVAGGGRTIVASSSNWSRGQMGPGLRTRCTISRAATTAAIPMLASFSMLRETSMA